jgi:hypothetical protein
LWHMVRLALIRSGKGRELCVSTVEAKPSLEACGLGFESTIDTDHTFFSCVR